MTKWMAASAAACTLMLAGTAHAEYWDGVFSGTAVLNFEAINGTETTFDPFSAAFTATGHGPTDSVRGTSFATMNIVGAEDVSFSGMGNLFGPDFANYDPYQYGFITYVLGSDYIEIALDIDGNTSCDACQFTVNDTAANGDIIQRSYLLTDVSYNGDDKPPQGPEPPTDPPGAPEPASWALMFAGVAIAGAALRRRHVDAAPVRASEQSA